MSYANQIATARNAIAKKGLLTTIRRVTPGSYNPETGVWGASATKEQPIYVLVLPMSPGRDDSFEVATSKMSRGRKLMLSLPVGAAWEPAAGDEVFFEARWWSLPGVSALRPDGAAGAALYYDALVQTAAG